MTTLSSEAERLADKCENGYLIGPTDRNAAADLLRRIPELEDEREKLAIRLNDLTVLNEYVKERRAQISHRLWVWAHEELSEPLKTRYFNIVANGTADVMEQPTYAQQFNAMKHRAEASEAERDQLRAELECREVYAYDVQEPNGNSSLAYAAWFHRYGNPLPEGAIPLYAGTTTQEGDK